MGPHNLTDSHDHEGALQEGKHVQPPLHRHLPGLKARDIDRRLPTRIAHHNSSDDVLDEDTAAEAS